MLPFKMSLPTGSREVTTAESSFLRSHEIRFSDLRRKHANKHIGYKAYPYEYLYKILGLYRIPTTAPWKQTAKAYERR
ncbi:MAG: hypothetical protein SCALA701_03500 [Candidatus Scalindua sp.]|nr:MAG: hypothetical protein SCALA701_03500 [Candidatus Scalindua sp.]